MFLKKIGSYNEAFLSYSQGGFMTKNGKERLILILLCFAFGMLGAHRFYAGKIKTGFLMLVTFGGVGVWYLFDLFRLLFTKPKKKRRRALA